MPLFPWIEDFIYIDIWVVLVWSQNVLNQAAFKSRHILKSFAKDTLALKHIAYSCRSALPLIVSMLVKKEDFMNEDTEVKKTFEFKCFAPWKLY